MSSQASRFDLERCIRGYFDEGFCDILLPPEMAIKSQAQGHLKDLS